MKSTSAHATEEKSKIGNKSDLNPRDVQRLVEERKRDNLLFPLLERRIWSEIIYFRPATKVPLRPIGKWYVVHLRTREFAWIVDGDGLS